MNNENKGFVASIDAKLDAIGNKLKKKEWKVPTDLLGGVIFLIFGLVMLYIIPLQVEVKKRELINGKAFPNLLMYVMIACSIILILNQVIKLMRKEPVKTTTINLLVEVKALLIYSEDDKMCKKAPHYDTLWEGLKDKENVRFLLVKNKGHNPNFTEDAVRYKDSFFADLTKKTKKKRLETKEAKKAFIASYDWERMTAQDEAVWQEIYHALES